MQTKKQSIIESCTNIGTGYIISMIANYFVLPLFGYSVDMAKSAKIAVVFSVISIVRSYVIRRCFNRGNK